MRNRVLIARRCERGDGDSFATTVYTPVLFGLLVLGVFFAIIGLARASAAAATERGAYAGATDAAGTSEGLARQRSFFDGFTGGQSAGAAYAYDPARRTGVLVFSRPQSWAAPYFRAGVTSEDAQVEQRFERFYAGPADCRSGECRE